MSVKDGRIVLPDGMSYRVLVLPQVETMTPRLLRKIRELVEAGATVVGAPPKKSPSLQDYPECDEEVAALAAELWGDGPASGEPSALVGKAASSGRASSSRSRRRLRQREFVRFGASGSGSPKAIPPAARRRARVTSVAS